MTAESSSLASAEVISASSRMVSNISSLILSAADRSRVLPVTSRKRTPIVSYASNRITVQRILDTKLLISGIIVVLLLTASKFELYCMATIKSLIFRKLNKLRSLFCSYFMLNYTGVSSLTKL